MEGGTGSGESAGLQKLVAPEAQVSRPLRQAAAWSWCLLLTAAAIYLTFRLAVSLLAIFWVYRLGLRARRRYRGRRTEILVLGALAAFTTAVVHAFFDFGLHLPSVAALTAVVAAHLAALGGTREPLRLHGVVPPLAAAVLGPTTAGLLLVYLRRHVAIVPPGLGDAACVARFGRGPAKHVPIAEPV